MKIVAGDAFNTHAKDHLNLSPLPLIFGSRETPWEIPLSNCKTLLTLCYSHYMIRNY
jgi:hypothetical protein